MSLYSTSFWGIFPPKVVKHKDEIENVQRRTTKQLPGMSNLSYPVVMSPGGRFSLKLDEV
jgi:hypothetical protein